MSAPAIGNYEEKERHDLEAAMAKVAGFNGLMGVARDELKLLKVVALASTSKLSPQRPSPDNQAGPRPVAPLLARAAFWS